MKKQKKQNRRHDRYWFDIEGDDVIVFKNDKFIKSFPIDYTQDNIFHEAERWLKR